MNHADILNVAASHGLQIGDDILLNEMGIDFQVAFTTDIKGTQWVLRIPRRDSLSSQIEQEKKVLDIAKKYLSISVPDWQIASSELVAYPLLENKPILSFCPETHEITWNVDPKEGRIVGSLAGVLAELHRIPIRETITTGIPSQTSEMVRQEVLDNIALVKRELGMSDELETRWRRWVDSDSLWPDFTTFIHGDLYAGHILADEKGKVSGIIDWSEGRVGDPSVDFAGHMTVFGEQSLRDLIDGYERLGGTVWKGMVEHTLERQSAAPLDYAVFAIKTRLDEHITAVKGQLGLC